MQLILCRNYTLGSILLRLLMWSRWSHSAIWDSEQGVVYDSSMLQGGVKKTEELAWFKRYPDHEIRDLGVHDTQVARAWLEAQVGKPYDWAAVLALPLRNGWHNEKAWFCSELSEALRTLFGTPRFRSKAKRITPHHQDIVL